MPDCSGNDEASQFARVLASQLGQFSNQTEPLMVVFGLVDDVAMSSNPDAATLRNETRTSTTMPPMIATGVNQR